jgi:hypothetical protein
MTGKKPREKKDYFYPQTGGTDEHGDPERIMLPTYMKDIYPILSQRNAKESAKTALTMASHKLHPFLTTIAEMLQNKDYYGTEIRHPDDPFIQQAKDAAEHISESFIPFGFRGVIRERERGGSISKQVLPMVGVTPAPRAINQTEAEKMIREFEQESRPQGTRTKAEAERGRLKSQAVRAVAAGDQAGIAMMERARTAGLLTDKDIKQVKERAKESPVARGFKSLTIDQALKVWDVATDEERKLLRPMLERKTALLENLPDVERERVAVKLGQALGLNREEIQGQTSAARHRLTDATDAEKALLVRLDQEHDDARAKLAAREEFKALPEEKQKEMQRRLSIIFSQSGVSKQARALTDKDRTELAKGKLEGLEELVKQKYFDQIIDSLLDIAKEK